MDPLAVLRDYTRRNDLDNVKQVGDEFHFGDDYKFPSAIETAYRSKQGSRYTLEALVFFIKNKQLKHTEYMQQALSQKLQNVVFTDRKNLLEYLEGKVATTEAIDLLLPTVPASSTREDRVSKQDGEGNVPAVKKAKVEGDGVDLDYAPPVEETVRLIDLIRERERPVRDRETILLCSNKSFEGILTTLVKRDEEKKKSEEQRKESDKMPEPAPDPSQQYGKRDSKGFWKADTDELGIDPTQSYIADGNKPKEATRPRQDSNQGVSQARRPPAHQHRPPAPSTNPKLKPDGPPIILVPNASQTLLNTYNAKEFLEDGVYVLPDVKAKSLSKKPDLLVIQRKIGRDVPVKYEVRDKPPSPKDWERVAAAFVLGKTWQFKGWPVESPLEIFNKIFGVYLRFEDDSMESAKVVTQWNVRIISLSKHKRHQDRTAVLEFWDKLDASLRARKSNLIF